MPSIAIYYYEDPSFARWIATSGDVANTAGMPD